MHYPPLDAGPHDDASPDLPKTVGSSRLPMRDANSPEGQREAAHHHQLEETQSLPGGFQKVMAAHVQHKAAAAAATAMPNAARHRRHSTLGLVPCQEEEDEQQVARQRRQAAMEQKGGGGVGPGVGVGAGVVGGLGPLDEESVGGAPMYVSSLYSPFQRPK